MSKPVKDTPCVGVCSTVYGDDVCRGCKRTLGQITDWNKADEDKRQLIYHELDTSLHLACNGIIEVTDLDLLTSKVEQYAVRKPRITTGAALAYYLLRAGAAKMQQLDRYGFKACPEYHSLTAKEIFQILDERWYQVRSKRDEGAVVD